MQICLKREWEIPYTHTHTRTHTHGARVGLLQKWPMKFTTANHVKTLRLSWVLPSCVFWNCYVLMHVLLIISKFSYLVKSFFL